MSVEIPSALIRRIQAKLRQSAGIPSSFDPSDPALLSYLPTLDDAISDIDADDPSHPRCGKCRRGAGLLRGARSTLCVFCGHDRRCDGVVQSLSFNSTAACKKLLESLQLDGSEVISLDTESKDSTMNQDTRDDGLILSSILDLELKWPPEKEEEEEEEEEDVRKSFDMAPVGVQVVNVSGVDLDTFFSESKNMIVSDASGVTREEFIRTDKTISTESHISSGSKKFGSLKDFPTPKMAPSSENTKDGDFTDSFADWGAGFQSATSQVSHAESESIGHYHGSSTAGPASPAADVTVTEDSRSVDFFEDPAIEFSTHATSVPIINEPSGIEHGIRNKVNSGEPADEWGQLSGSANWIQDDLLANTANQLRTTSKTNDSELKDDAQCMASAGDSWGDDEIWNMKPSNVKSEHNNDDVNSSDDPLDSWLDFASSKEEPGVSSSSCEQSANQVASKEEASMLRDVDVQDKDFGSFFQSDSFSGALGEQGGPNEVNDIQLNTSSSTGKIDECLNVKSMHGKHNVDSGFDDPLDSWQDFASSKEAREVSSISLIQSGNKISSNEHASTVKSVGIPLQSDSFFGAFGEQGDPQKVNNVKIDASDSTSNIEEFFKPKNSNENSFEGWQDATSSKGQSGGLSNLWTQNTTWSTLNEHASGTKSVEPHVMKSDSFLYSDSLSEPLGGQQDPREPNATKIDPPVFDASINVFNTTKQSDDNDDFLEDWQDFFSSSKEALGVLPSRATDTSRYHTPGVKPVDPQDSKVDILPFSDSFSGTLDGQKDPNEASDRGSNFPVRGSSINKSDTAKPNNDINDSLEDWQDFTSSKEAAGVLPDISDAEATSRYHASGIKPVDLQDLQVDSFLCSGSLSGALGVQKGPREASDRNLDPSISGANINDFDTTKQNNDNNDSLEDWLDFASSEVAPGILPNILGAEAISIFHSSGEKPVDPQDLELDGFLHSDALSGTLCAKKEHREGSARNLDPQVSSANMNEFDITRRNDANDDSLEDWQDFAGSKEVPGTKATLKDHTSGVKLVDAQDSEFGSFLNSDFFSGVGGMKGSSHVNDIQLDALVSDYSKTSNSINHNDGLFGSWKDFTSVNEVAHGLQNLSPTQTITEDSSQGHTSKVKPADLEDMEFGDFLQSDMFSGVSREEDSSKDKDVWLDTLVSTSNVNSFNNTKNVNDDDDPFDAWQDFISSSNEQKSSRSLMEEPNNRVTSSKHASGTKSLDLQDIDFGDFFGAGSLPGAFGEKF